ncbi:hypothetical protein RhiirA4_459909 [Rhizophagus irregularis]|uniref:Uncharacterized protein n=1 Tax=Rhizophagus irregularis TaxID=588596 RepID=A0A2I1GFF8_9GLOM|nr:hypothetical protein RhiirA4_459909 [Rhizophagus irregularis]
MSVWIKKLQNSINNIIDIFGKELYETENLLPIDIFNEFVVCRLGGNYGSDYACAFLHVFIPDLN